MSEVELMGNVTRISGCPDYRCLLRSPA